MALQSQVHYLAELLEGEPFHCAIILLDADEKRVHLIATMIAETDGRRAATYESLSMNVDLDARRGAPYPPGPAGRIRDLLAAHAGLARPQQVGRTIGIRRKG